jgi:ribosomal-protein-alanine N-acetyltransferase
MALSWTVRRGLPTDVAAIVALERACDEAPHWSETVWSEVVEGTLGIEPLRRNFVSEGVDGMVGFVVVSCSGGVAELESVAVADHARRKGVGRALCSAAMMWAGGMGARVMELEVRASSVKAVELYRSLGFTERGRRRRYYREPIEDAVLMSAELSS